MRAGSVFNIIDNKNVANKNLAYKKIANQAVLLVCMMLSCQLFAASEYRLPSGEILQDPTRPQQWQSAPIGQDTAPAAQTFTLNYIVRSGQEIRAMINGKKVLEGDQVAGATVQRIELDRVILSYQGQRQELRLNQVKGIKRH